FRAETVEQVRVFAHDEMGIQRDPLADCRQVVERAHRHVDLVAQALHVEHELRRILLDQYSGKTPDHGCGNAARCARTSCSDRKTSGSSASNAIEGCSMSGTMIGVMPAATAPRTPASESSMTTQSVASMHSRFAVSMKISGAGLPRAISSPPTSAAK